MFVQFFGSYLCEEIFPWSFSEWLSVQACIYFKTHQKHTKLINQIKVKTKTKVKIKGNIYIIYKDGIQAKYLFRTWPFTG
jgi:hypothetical protein